MTAVESRQESTQVSRSATLAAIAERVTARSVFAGVLAGATLVLAGCQPQTTPPDPVRPVQMQQISVASSPDLAVFAGEVRARHEADLAFQIGGKLVSRSVDMGAAVKKGDVLARLDPADVRLQAQAANAAVAAAETEHRFAQAEYDRYQNLFAQKFVSASALDQKRNAQDSARAKLEQARAQLDVSRNQAAYATLIADHDGVITSVLAEPGQVVAAAQAVMRLAQEGEREVAISVPENRIGELKSARSIAVVLWADPTRVYAARVREIAPAVDAITRTFAVRVSILDAGADVQLGMTANVALQTTQGLPSVVLPLASVYRKEGLPAVWIFDPATRQVGLQPITIGQFREDGVVVTSGLAAGQWVVTAGVHKLHPGQTVRRYESGTKEADAR